MNTNDLSTLNIEAVAQAIEQDAGQAIPHLHRSLNDAATMTGRVTTPQQIAARRVGITPLSNPRKQRFTKAGAGLMLWAVFKGV